MANSSSPAHSRYHYHEIAADVLKVRRPSTAVSQLLEAAELGNVNVCEKLLKQYKGIVDMRCEETGDTPLIAAARCQQYQVINLLLSYSADCTLQNDNGETVLEVSTPKTKNHIIKLLSSSTSPSSPRDLLHAAWLGDAVTVTKSLNGDKRIDVNCRNSDGLTPLLLVTRDTGVFEQVQHVMKTEYNPLEVMEQLIKNDGDLKAKDCEGRNALHLVANNKSIQAKKMVSLLLESGADSDSKDDDNYTPLHIASRMGHTAIVVALIEEGNASINERGGEKGDTPLMQSASQGHKEATQYLLSKGADVTLKNEAGADALSLAKTPSLISMIKDAWVDDKAHGDDHNVEVVGQSYESILPVESNDEYNESSIATLKEINPFFLTERRTSYPPDDQGGGLIMTTTDNNVEETDGSTPDLIMPNSEVEADDEQDDGIVGSVRRLKPATRRTQMRHNMEETLAKRNYLTKERAIATPPNKALLRERSRTFGETSGSSSRYNGGHRSGQKKTALQERLTRSNSRHMLDSSNSLSRSLESLNSEVAGAGAVRKVTPPAVSHVSLHNTSPGGGLEQRRATLPTLTKSSSRELRTSKMKGVRSSSSIEHLPSISSFNMKPIALVSVDAETENLRVQNLNKKSPLKKQQSSTDQLTAHPMSRSRSLQSIRQISTPPVKRNSTDTPLPPVHHSSDQPSAVSKVPLLPSVVTPQLNTTQPTNKNPFPSSFTHSPRNITASRQQQHKQSSPQQQQPSPQQQPPPHAQSAATHQLPSNAVQFAVSSGQLSSVAEESREFSTGSSSNDKTLVPLEPPQQQQQQQIKQQQQPVNDNDVIHYAEPVSGSVPLSPIWDMARQRQKTDSETTSSEYISSYIGAKTPFPHHLLSDSSPLKKPAGDSGQGESEDDQRQQRVLYSSESESEEVSIDQGVLKWKRGRVLGKGAFGKVWEGLMDNAKLIAVKEIELDINSSRDKVQSQFGKIQQEVDILRSLSHKNIVQYFGASMSDSTVYIFMEFISGGSVQSVLKRFGSLDERTVAHYSRQVAQGLEYLHNNGIIHRDIKGANIMVTSKGIVKLIDFGCAKRHCQDISDCFHSVRGTPFWMSPEVIRGQSYGRKSDIWSLGCTIHEMIMTKPPWGELPPEAAMFHIGIGQNLPPLPDHLSSNIKNIIDICLAREPQSRPTAGEVLKHPFLSIDKQSNSLKRKTKKRN